MCNATKIAYSTRNTLVWNTKKTCSGCCQQNILKVVSADQEGLCKDEGFKVCRATCKAPSTLQTREPCPRTGFFTEMPRPGIVIIEYGNIGRMLVAKDNRFRFRVIIHTVIRIEMIGVHIRHDSHRWTHTVGS